MLLVRRPDEAGLIQILDGLLAGDMSREAVLSWYKAVIAAYEEPMATLSPGYWYFQCLSALSIPIVLAAGQDFFIRDQDLAEYRLDLMRVPATESWRDIRRLRGHEVDAATVYRPLMVIDHADPGLLPNLGLTPVRGIFDPHQDLVEHAHLAFGADRYLLVRQFDEGAHELMVLGTSRSQDQLAAFLAALL